MTKEEFKNMFKPGDYVEHHWKGPRSGKRETVVEIRKGYITGSDTHYGTSYESPCWNFGECYLFRIEDVEDGSLKHFPPEEYPEYYI